jgi:negative regulator of genetic competence, sporulation and motility
VSEGEKSSVSIETVDPIEVIINEFSQLMDNIDYQVSNIVSIHIRDLFGREERFIEYYIAVLSNEDKIREVVKRFIKYSLPKLISIITEYPDPSDPRVLNLRNMLIREIIDNGLSRAFCEVIHS